MSISSLVVWLTFLACSGGEQAAAPAPEPAGVPVAAPAEDIGEQVAKVGDTVIGSKQYQAAASRQTPKDGKAFSAEEKKKILDDLVVEELLYQEALVKGIHRDPKIKRSMVGQLLKQDVYAEVRNSDFTPEEMQAYFDAHKHEFVIPEKIQLKRVFVKIDETRDDAAAKARAMEAYNKLKGKPDAFMEVAGEFSDDPFKRRGGDLGWVVREGKPGVDPEVIAKAFETEPNKLTEPFLAGGGYNVILVAGKREKMERTFEQMKGSVLRSLKNERYTKLTDDYVAKLKTGKAIEVDDAKVQGIEVASGRRAAPTELGLRPPMGPGDEDEGGAPHGDGDEGQ